MTDLNDKVIGKIQPGPVKGSRIVLDRRDGALAIEITVTDSVPLPPAPPRPDGPRTS